MSGGNGLPRTYSISISPVQRAHLLQLREEQGALGRGSQFVAAVRAIDRRLRRDPRIFGEQLFTLPALNLEIRQAAVHPLVVDYGVHEAKRIVFIKGFKVMG